MFSPLCWENCWSQNACRIWIVVTRSNGEVVGTLYVYSVSALPEHCNIEHLKISYNRPTWIDLCDYTYMAKSPINGAASKLFVTLPVCYRKTPACNSSIDECMILPCNLVIYCSFSILRKIWLTFWQHLILVQTALEAEVARQISHCLSTDPVSCNLK